jgi:predicted DNA binding CopG/RHH family protein
MAKKLVIPSFSSDAEDAEWHWKHRRELEDEFLRRMKEGTTLSRPRRTSRDNPPLRPVTIRLSPEDIQSAQKQASERGMGYQTYLRIVLTDALRRTASRRGG